MLRFLVVVAALVLLPTVFTQGVWCGKQYPAVPGSAIQPANASDPYPVPQYPSRNFSVTPNLHPYTTEVVANLFVTLLGPNLPSAIFTASTTTGLQLVGSVSVPAGGRVALPFNISALPQTTGTPTTVLCAISSPTTGRLIEQQVLYIYRLLPNPNNGTTTKIDFSLFRFLVQNLTTGNYSAIFPYGFYYDSTWLMTNLSHVDLVKSMGVTSLQPVYPYDLDLMEEMMTYAYNIGLHVVVDLKNFLVNDTALVESVLRFRSHPALLSYYLADEPDGWGVPPELVTAAHMLVKAMDAYHPTMLVLNCYYLFPQWIDAADVLMADPYPVGVNSTPCNATYGCCGCDDCIGSVTDVPQRAVAFYAEIGPYTKPLWLVLQAFGAQAHWSRWPTPAEERYMTYSALIAGAIGISYWMYPTGSLPPSNSSMSRELISIGNELLVLSEMFLSAAPLAVSTSQLVIARAWRVNATNVLLLAANSAPSTAKIILKTQSTLSGTARVLYENGVSPRTLSGGVLDDTLAGFSVRIYSIDLSSSDDLVLDR